MRQLINVPRSIAKFAPLALCVLVGLLTLPIAKAESPESPFDFFEKSIRPVLVQHCYQCHSAEAVAQGKQKAELSLDSKQSLLTGGESGPAIMPGDPKKSLIVRALKYEGYEMPPSGRLPAEVIANFEKWVAMGAPDPRETSAAPVPRRAAFQITAEDRKHWAYQPLAQTAPPSVANNKWVKNELDPYVLAELERTGVGPSQPTARSTLLRRASFAIVGLPPTPEEVTAFEADSSSDAFASVVDRLLDSPEFGVHWGRHWLDGVRYADNIDKTGEYRRWVVRAFNSDLPYDQFVKLQIAGDLIPADASVPPERVHNSGVALDGITATGMMALAVWEQVGRDLAVAEIVDSQIDLIGRQMLGLTLACARCHDHKFDPISTQDYYAMAGILFSSHIATGKLIADDRLGNDPLMEVMLLNAQQEASNRQLDAAASALETQMTSVETKIPQAAKLSKVDYQITNLESQLTDKVTATTKKSLTDQIVKLNAEREMLLADQVAQGWDANPPELIEIKAIRDQIDEMRRKKFTAPSVVAIVEGGVPGSNREKIGDAPVYLRGEYQREGAIVHRRFPTILAGESQTPLGQRTQQSGRLELAEWITSPENPLTARVMVNRIWQQMIGRALVRSPDNFGRLGEKPTHPELLDALARQFIASGWSIKRLVRLIALSATFQQSSFIDSDAQPSDSDNRMLSHMHRRRLTFEELRDSLLRLGGPSTDASTTTTESSSQASDMPQRTMFASIDRRKTDVTAAIFDGPDPKAIVPERAETTTAPQALFLMNSPLAVSVSKSLAKRLENDKTLSSDTQRVERLWLLTLSRLPDADEESTALSFVANHSWERFVQALLGTNEFAYLD